MNIYKCLNEITKYIDDNLEDKIDYEILAKIMGVNSYTMQRIFSLIADISLSEYIRKRRLSSAGFDLYECIFCSHIANKRFCIANMQFEEEEYYEIKKAIIEWILNS